MNKDLIELLQQLTSQDKKTLSQKALKTAEEVGELARAVLPFENAFATTHRFVDRANILEEIADVILCALSIGFDLSYDFSEIEDTIRKKSLKWAELQARESKAKWPIPFELHVTVRNAKLEDFQLACTKLGVKPLLLDLQKDGSTVFHDLMTSHVHMGNNNSVYTELRRVADGLKAEGFEVVREKIEAAPWHPAAPSSAHENPVMPKNCYFECHFAVLCNEERMEGLRNLAKELGMHLSRNVFKRIDDTNFKIMTTYRRYEGVFEDFKQEVSTKANALKGAGFEVDKTIIEFSVYDTKVSHDASWLTK